MRFNCAQIALCSMSLADIDFVVNLKTAAGVVQIKQRAAASLGNHAHGLVEDLPALAVRAAKMSPAVQRVWTRTKTGLSG